MTRQPTFETGSLTQALFVENTGIIGTQSIWACALEDPQPSGDTTSQCQFDLLETARSRGKGLFHPSMADR